MSDDTVMNSLLITRTVLLAFVFPFYCNDTTPDCNFPTKEVSQLQLFLEAMPIILKLFSKARGHLKLFLE